MKIADANVYLRYLINDNVDLYVKAKEIIENDDILLPTEVLCEIVYVLEKVYKVTRLEISDTLSDLVQQPNIAIFDSEIIICAFNLFKESKFDFVDCILYGHVNVKKDDLVSFDEKLSKKISQIQVSG